VRDTNEIDLEFSTACFSKVDVMLVMDTSTSMQQTNGTGNSKIQDAKIAATNFVNHLDNKYDRAG